MELKQKVNNLILELSELIPIPENATPNNFITKSELEVELRKWQVRFNEYLDNPSLKNKSRKEKNIKVTQITDKGININSNH